MKGILTCCLIGWSSVIQADPFLRNDFYRAAAEPIIQVVYSNNFEGVIGPELTAAQVSTAPVGARRFLGEFGNRGITLALSNLPPHAAAQVSFDLFVICSWDGNNNANRPGQGPDIFDVRISGEPTRLHTTFSNTEAQGNRQSYPGSFPGSNYAGGTGAVEVNTLGYQFINGPTDIRIMDSVYHIVDAFEHTSDLISVEFAASGLQDSSNESWGMDNVVLTTIRPPAFRPEGLKFETNDLVTVSLNVPVGLRVVVEVSEDLLQWGAISDRIETESALTVNDTAAAGQRTRFYRAKYSLP